MEYTLPREDVAAALRRAAASRFAGTPGERELHVFKAFRAKFGMDFVEWRGKTEHEIIVNDDGSLTMREPEAEKPAKASKRKGKKRRKKAKKRAAKAKPAAVMPAEPMTVAA